MRKICKPYQNDKNICSSILLPNSLIQNFKSAYKLTTIGLLLVLAGISGCSPSTNAQSSSQSEKWPGKWQFKDPFGSGQSIKIILTTEGKAYVLPPEGVSDKNVAYDIPLEKVSDKTSLPANTKVVTLQDMMTSQANKARQAEGKTYVGSMNRSQQAYFLENNKFATKLNELQLGIKSETDNYIFKVVPQSNQVKGIMNIARAKRQGLKSYVGLVYLAKVGSEDFTIAKLCETSQSLSKPPKMPSLTKNSAKSKDIECPSGFKSLN